MDGGNCVREFSSENRQTGRERESGRKRERRRGRAIDCCACEENSLQFVCREFVALCVAVR